MWEAGKPHIDDYVIETEIHRGGQGVVYRAIQVGTKREVALKVLLEGPYASEDARRRFEREVELAASLKHPNIVTILDSGISQGRYYFAMEYIDGPRLDQYFRSEKPAMRQTLELFERICSAVNFAHQRGVIHRDLKPSNILVDKEGQPHVLDFGLAKHTQQHASGQTVKLVSTTGQILGTVAYMSPEQAAAPQDVDVRSDVYSLGVIFYEALLGQPPYVVSGPLGEVLNNIASVDPTSPRSIRMKSRFGREVDDELSTILLKALEKEPVRRYQSVGNLGRDIRRYLDGEPIDAKRASGFYIIRKTLKRYRGYAYGAGAVLGLILIFMVVLAFLYQRESAARTDAEEARQLAGEKALAAERAREQAQAARLEAERAASALRESLTRQEIQQGDLARERGDLAAARDSYWRAFQDSGSDAARWNLRQYYFESGELSAQQLYLSATGAAGVSPDGKHAAACNQPDSVAVYRLEDGAAMGWYPTPGVASAVVVDNEGRIAVCGRGWARVFNGTSQKPERALSLPRDFEADAMLMTRTGELILMNEASLIRARAVGNSWERIALPGMRTGRPDYSGVLDAIAIPTTSGVMLARRASDGSYQSEMIWRPKEVKEAPRAVHFAGDEVLAVLAGKVEMVRVGSEDHGQTIPFLEPEGTWDFVDVGHGAGTLVLGKRDGRVALFRTGKLAREWRIGTNRLEDVHFVVEEGAIVTLDDRGTLTRWAVTRGSDRKQTIVDRAASSWTIAGDGSAAAIVDTEGRVTVYSAKSGRTRVIGPGRMITRLPGTGASDVSVSFTDDGELLLLRRGDQLSIVTPSDRRPTPLSPWRSSASPLMRDAVISGEGEVVAVRSESAAGDKQQIAFLGRTRTSGPRRTIGSDGLRPIGETVELTAGAVRAMVFLPGTNKLVLARSSGVLETVEPGQRAPSEWMTLDAPPLRVAAARTMLAVACEDGAVYVYDTSKSVRVARIYLGASATSVSLNGKADLLLARTTTGELRMHELPSGETALRWTKPDGKSGMAAFVGEGDTLLVENADGVALIPFAGVDQMIQRNARFALQRMAVAELNAGEYEAAWETTGRMGLEYGPSASAARQEIVETLLRRPTQPIPEGWMVEVLGTEPSTGTLLRMAHAAYVGKRYEKAREWFGAALTRTPGGLDAYSLLRAADCDYLFERYEASAARYGEVGTKPDLDPADRPVAQLLLTASLFQLGQKEQAQQTGMMIGVGSAEQADRVALTTAKSIGRYMAGVGGESLVVSTLGGLIANLTEGSLNYQDDPYFFFGEVARKRGNARDAAANYQRCIDLARDEWPSNWARWRLRQSAGERVVD